MYQPIKQNTMEHVLWIDKFDIFSSKVKNWNVLLIQDKTECPCSWAVVELLLLIKLTWLCLQLADTELWSTQRRLQQFGRGWTPWWSWNMMRVIQRYLVQRHLNYKAVINSVRPSSNRLHRSPPSNHKYRKSSSVKPTIIYKCTCSIQGTWHPWSSCWGAGLSASACASWNDTVKTLHYLTKTH